MKRFFPEHISLQDTTLILEQDRFEDVDFQSLLPDLSMSLTLGLARIAVHRQPKGRVPDFIIEFILPAIAADVVTTFLKHIATRGWPEARRWAVEKVVPEIKRQHALMKRMLGRDPDYYGVVSFGVEGGYELNFHVFSSQQFIATYDYMNEYLYLLDDPPNPENRRINLFWDYDKQAFRVFGEDERIPDSWRILEDRDSRWDAPTEPSPE